MDRYILGIVTGLAFALLGLTGLYVAGSTFWPDRMPAPALTVLDLLDDKLRYLRERPGLDPRLVAVGSSITWRQLDGTAFASKLDGQFLNGATGFLQTHQSRFLADFYLDLYPQIETVLTLVGPPDFVNCNGEASIFDTGDAREYISGSYAPMLPFLFYLKYFVPSRYLRIAISLPKSRTPLIGDMYLDQFGSSPMQWTREMKAGLRYGDLHQDPACIAALVGLARDVAAKGRRLVIVFAPINPQYMSAYPATVERTRRALARLQQDVRSLESARVISMIDGPFAASDFFDAVHLQWEAARIFSKDLAARIFDGHVRNVGVPVNRITNAPSLSVK